MDSVPLYSPTLTHAGLSFCARRRRFVVSLIDGAALHRTCCNPRRCDHGREMGKYAEARDAAAYMQQLNAELAAEVSS